MTLTQKNNRGHLMVMNNRHIKFVVPRPKGSLVIDRKPFDLWTDRQTQMHLALYTPTSVKSKSS
jgi:hypothetical protein